MGNKGGKEQRGGAADPTKSAEAAAKLKKQVSSNKVSAESAPYRMGSSDEDEPIMKRKPNPNGFSAPGASEKVAAKPDSTSAATTAHNEASSSGDEVDMLDKILQDKVAAEKKKLETLRKKSNPTSPVDEMPGSLAHKNQDPYSGMSTSPAVESVLSAGARVKAKSNSTRQGKAGKQPLSGDNLPSKIDSAVQPPKGEAKAEDRGQLDDSHHGSTTAKNDMLQVSNESPTFGASPKKSPKTKAGAKRKNQKTMKSFLDDSEDEGIGSPRGLVARQSPGQKEMSDDQDMSSLPLSKVIAAFQPTGDDQLQVRKNEVVRVIDESCAEEYGWIWVCRKGDPEAQGWVPFNCIDGNYWFEEDISKRASKESVVSQPDPDDPLSQWNDKLHETFVLHSMRNLVRLVQYVVNLLNPYGAATSLHIACWRGSIDAVEVMLEADPDLIKRLHSTAGQLTPLHVATICNYSEVVSFLLDARANCNIPTVHDLCPLHLAASANNELVEMLVGARANVDAEDADGNTPLMFACCYHQVETIEYLVEKQAEVRKCNRWDVSPLHLAAAYAELDGALFGLQLIMSMGGDPWIKDAGNVTPLQTIKKVLGGVSKHPILDFIQQFTSVTKLKPAARQAVLKKRRREREAKEAAKEAEAEKEEHKEPTADEDEDDRGINFDDELPSGKGRKSAADQQQKSKGHVQAASTIGAELQKEIQKLSAENRDLQTKLEKMALDMKQAESSKNASKDLANQLSEQRKKAQADFDKQLEKERNEMKKKLAQVEEEKERAIAERKAEAEKLRKQMHDQVAASAKAGSEKTSAEVAALEVRIKQLEADVQSKNGEVDEKRQEIIRLKEEISKLKEESSKNSKSLGSELEQKKEAVRVLESQIKELRSQNDISLSEISSANKKLEKLNDYIDRAEKAERAMGPLEQRNIQLEHMFAEEQALRRKYHNQIQELKGAIRVYCRVRPLIKKELDAKEKIFLHKSDEFAVTLKREGNREDKSYNFDGIFDESNSQEQIFKDCKDLIQSAVDGYNVTVFAYGQTGAGKTHTMYGGKGEMAGLLPRTVKEVFRIKTQNSNRYEIKVKVYMVEVYRDDLTDLLLPKNKKATGPLEIKRDHRGTVYIENVSEVEVHSEDEMFGAFERGMEKRRVSATKMNTESSRSHLISTILLEIYNRSKKTTSLGKITLVDLAGSERLKKSEATGDQMKEAMAINKSLTALGDVIEALTSKAKHIPYRNHKLTELMSDSLGGNAKTLMFANCSPAASNAEESMGCLNYATRAKQITNNVSKQQESKEVARLKQVIATMSKEMDMKQNLAAPDSAGLKEALLGT